MSFNPSETHKLPEGWQRPDTAMANIHHAELQRELPPGHLLHGVPVENFAWSRGSDDVLFRHLNEPDHFTIIHLSWLGRTEINAQHPTVEFDGSFAEFLAYYEKLLTFLKDVSKNRNA